jgi:hypothetical protein
LAETTAVYVSGKKNARFLASMNTKGTILVVDDEESLRYTTRLMLQDAAFEVTEAATGQEALQLAEEHLYPAPKSGPRRSPPAPTATSRGRSTPRNCWPRSQHCSPAAPRKISVGRSAPHTSATRPPIGP